MTILIQATHGAEDTEKATLPFLVANVAATADQHVKIFLTSEAVRLATDGYATGIHHDGLPALADLVTDCVANGVEILACAACLGPRGIDPGTLIAGATVVTAVNLVEELVAGAHTLAF